MLKYSLVFLVLYAEHMQDTASFYAAGRSTGAHEQAKQTRASAGVNRIQTRARVTLSGQAVAGKQAAYTISE